MNGLYINNKAKIALIRDVMDYSMRECMIKAFEEAYTEEIGDDWFDMYIEFDRKQEHPIAKYRKGKCEWIEGIKHADFVATMKMLKYGNEKFRNTFYKYWGCEKERKDIESLSVYLIDFRNRISHINSETSFEFKNPDEVMMYIYRISNIFKNLRNDEGELYCEIITEEYDKYKKICKEFVIDKVIESQKLSLSSEELIRICKQNNIEIDETNNLIITDNINGVIRVIGNNKNININKRIYIWLVIVVCGILFAVLLFLGIKKNMESLKTEENRELSSGDVHNVDDKYRLTLNKTVKTEEGVVVNMTLYNGKKETITEGMMLEIYLKLVDINNNELPYVVYLPIEKSLYRGEGRMLEKLLRWDKIGISSEKYKKIILVNCEVKE